MCPLSRQDLQGAIDKSELLREENKARWPPHNPHTGKHSRLSIWEVLPKEVKQEEEAQMVHD
jgi:hypothetical protein